MTNANQISLILKLAAMSLYVCARILPTDTNHKLYVDNWFNSIPLNIYIFERGIEMVGTVRRYRIGKCPVMSESYWTYLFYWTPYIDGVNISVVSWLDNKVVTLL